MQVHLNALGCRLNEAELQTWAQVLQLRGHSIARQVEEADAIVLNTCAVTGEAARKSRQMIRRYHRSNPSAKLVVTGCYASLSPQEANDILGVDLVVPNTEKDQLVDQLSDLMALPTMPAMATEPAEPALFARNRERAFIKIQDGCRYRCTFCIVTVARGEERSRTIKDIIDEINRHYADGVQEIVLTGVHVGGYGSDLDTSLYELVQAVLSDTDMPRIRFASVEPWDLPEQFFELFSNPRLLPHMHLPLQSGTDSVLRRMARRCKTAAYTELVNDARRRVPGFNVTTDIIVGFPGETDDEFEQSLQYIEQTGFGHIHIFTYSQREGTKAARLPNQVSKEIKKIRSQRLHQLAEKLRAEAMSRHIGQQLPVLWEGHSQSLENGGRRFFGHLPNYHKVALDLPATVDVANSILPTRIRGYDASLQCLVGELEGNLGLVAATHKATAIPVVTTG